MANPWAGEVVLVVDGERRVAKLTLGALAELEAELGADTLVELVARFEDGRARSRDLIALLAAGLRGGGWAGTAADLARAEVAGGGLDAVRAAGQLLARGFGAA
ncbi:gene transfer agent family protein [Palleronia sediminis]|uniref:Gene transfer agent family protein n=1 Tax=Palleronia sediminis TaxID=2547833 RepID=A0A4R6ADP9_9RHOB|nr:gene transfer agent family protein [Palleronia sediminis]TDL79556.1 gene transfer agent family protein [Palleronia sediminis]